MPMCASVSDEEVSMRENLRIASQISNLGTVHDHTYSLCEKRENKEVNCMVSGNDTCASTNVRRLNDTINLQHLTSLPEHFRFIGADDNSHLSISNREGNQGSTEVPMCASVSDEEVSMRENLRIASQITTYCDKDIMAAYIKDIGVLPTKFVFHASIFFLLQKLSAAILTMKS